MNTRLDKRREEFQREVTKLQNEQLMINSELHGPAAAAVLLGQHALPQATR